MSIPAEVLDKIVEYNNSTILVENMFRMITQSDDTIVNIIATRKWLYNGKTFEDIPHGQGKIYTPQGKLVYDGEWLHGEYHNKGTVYYYTLGSNIPGEIHYDGQWNKGKKHGQGKWYSTLGTLLYEGHWNNDVKHGQGKLYDTLGYILYDGEWYKGVRHGLGKSFKQDGTIEYDGEWYKGLPKL